MMLTPDDAKALLCGPSMASERSCNCAADKCMAWRWSSSLTVNNPTQQRGMATQEIRQTHGYCGIAGKP